MRHGSFQWGSPLHRTAMFLILGGLLCPLSLLRAELVTLSDANGVIDQGYEHDKAVCTAVAISNLLHYLSLNSPGAKGLIRDGETPGQTQESVQKRWDPDLTGSYPSGPDAKTAVERELTARGFKGTVKLFGRQQLTYEALLGEWNSDERILLFITNRDHTVGHCVFLWGLENDPNAAEKKVSVVDPNGHPNQNPVLSFDDGQGGTTETRVSSNGAAHTTALTFESDVNGPKWGIRYVAPQHTYTLPDGSTWESDAYVWSGYVLGFMSVSDVALIPLPAPALMAGVGLGLAALLTTWRARQRVRT